MFRIAALCLMSLALRSPLAAGCPATAGARYEPRSFLGYACTDDCGQHKAGFAWADRHAVTDAERCAALPQPQTEGCTAYVEEGRDARAAGRRWATENEIVHPCECAGAGERFRAGCVRATGRPVDPPG